MKKIILTILFLLFSFQYVIAAKTEVAVDKSTTKSETSDDMILPNIFIYSPPPPTGDEVKLNDSDTVKINDTENPYHKVRYDDSSVARYELETEGEDVVTLRDVHSKSLNINDPSSTKVFQLNAQKTRNLIPTSVMPSMYMPEEYRISPLNRNQVETAGNFSFGTLYSSGIDTSQLEYNAGLFTRYEREKFAISTAYQKNQGTAYGLTTDNFYFSPEFKLNNSISISSIIKTDTTRNRKSNEFVLKIKPFAYKGNDRVNLEFGAGQTYDENNALFKTQFRFNTSIQL